MKVCIAAGVILALLVAAVAGNAVYIHTVTDALSSAVEALPEVPDPATTPAEIAAITARFEHHLAGLGLSVSFTLLDRVQESLVLLHAYAESGDVWQYAATRKLLADQIEDLARLEQLRADNIF